MADELTKAPPKEPAWGYSKDEPEGKIFDDGKLPKGYYPNPAMVPGSEAEKRYREDAAREGVTVPWDAPAPQGDQKPVTVPQFAQQAAGDLNAKAK